MNADEKAVADVLAAYERALNASDRDAVMRLYAPDGIFMAQNFPSAVGADAVRKGYEKVFATITLTVKFAVAEVKQLAPEWAMARTNSAGSVRAHATGTSSAEANQELFLFHKIGAEWKIARYCFSTTNPPRA